MSRLHRSLCGANADPGRLRLQDSTLRELHLLGHSEINWASMDCFLVFFVQDSIEAGKTYPLTRGLALLTFNELDWYLEAVRATSGSW